MRKPSFILAYRASWLFGKTSSMVAPRQAPVSLADVLGEIPGRITCEDLAKGIINLLAYSPITKFISVILRVIWRFRFVQRLRFQAVP